MITFTNDQTKRYLARRGPTAVFGFDVDRREKLSDNSAIELFDQTWKQTLEREIQAAPKCGLDLVFERLFETARPRVKPTAEHRAFRISNCDFIAQLSSDTECDELWPIFSGSVDPRTLVIKFSTVAEREKLTEIAGRIGHEDSALAIELIRDFVRKFIPTEK